MGPRSRRVSRGPPRVNGKRRDPEPRPATPTLTPTLTLTLTPTLTPTPTSTSTSTPTPTSTPTSSCYPAISNVALIVHFPAFAARNASL